MKKLLLGLLLTIGLTAQDSPYIGVGISGIVANVDEVGDCRLSTSLIAGATIQMKEDFAVSVEGRKLTNFRSNFDSSEIYFKPQYKGVYALLGYGRFNYEDETTFGYRYGAGYDFGIDWKHLFVDVVYSESEKTTSVTGGFVYRFEGF